MKAQEEKSKSIIEVMKVRHEQEIFNLRRQFAAAQREKTNIAKEMDALNTELKICQAKLAVKQASRPTEEINVEPEPILITIPEVSDSEPSHPPQQTTNRNQTLETETLKQSLSHAHRIISNLRSSLNKEKIEKSEIKKMLADTQEKIEQLQDENASRMKPASKKKASSKKKRNTGVARKPKGVYASASSGSSEEEEMMDPQFALDEAFGATLSSELEENKMVQVKDACINTDPMDTERNIEIMRIDETALRAKIEDELKQDMIPKSQMNVLLEEVKLKAKVELESKIQQSEIKLMNDLTKDWVPRSQVDTLIQEAVKDTKSELEVSIRRSVEEELEKVYKSEVEAIKQTQAMNEELLMKQAIEDELKQGMVLKSELKLLLENARREAQEDMVTKDEAETMVQAALERDNKEQELNNLLVKSNLIEQEALEKALNQQKLKLEKIHADDLTLQKREMQHIQKEELDKFALELKLQHNTELEKQKTELEQRAKLQLDIQKQEMSESMKLEMEKQLQEQNIAHRAKIDELAQQLDFQNKEYEALKQQMNQMLIKENVSVMIDKAVMETEKKYKELMSDMMTKEQSDRLVADAIKSVREEETPEDRIEMISKVEAEALAKVAVADAIVKERQTVANLEKVLVTKEEADLMIEAAIEKYKSDNAVAKERKSIKEYIPATKDEGEKSTVLQDNPTSPTAVSANKSEESIEIPVAENTQNVHQKDHLSSVSEATAPSINLILSPSMSTPVSVGRKLRLSSSAHSLRLGSSNTDDDKSIATNYGSVRVLNTTKYGTAASSSLKDLSRKQSSTVSISTLSSSEDRFHMPGAFSGFSDPSIDPEVISAITQTMIGDWMFKHTRRYVGGGISEKKHQRFFWIHPYTKTLYWSSVQPGTEGSEGKTKSGKSLPYKIESIHLTNLNYH